MASLSKSDFLKLIPNYVLEIAETLQKNNFQAYLVGGGIRDILVGITPKDYDIATNALPEEVVKIFPKSIPTGAKFGTITVVTQNEKGEHFDIEVTTYRSEEDYVDGRWPTKVEFTKTIDEDLSRRDFTINAIALDLQNFDNPSASVHDILVDPFGGLKDLENRVVKAVGEPIERFSEDGLRAVRGCRLASQLDAIVQENEKHFEIEPKTFEAMKQTNHVTAKVAVERFREELLKTLYESPKPSKGLKLMKEAGILQIFIPELLEGIGIEQPQFHTDDVFEHLLKTCDAAEDSIRLAALFHDIAKPRTFSQDEKGVHFYGHDAMGAEMTEEIMRRLKFSNAEIEKTASLVRWHMFYYPSADWRKGHGMGNKYVKLPEEKIEDQNLGWSDGAVRRLIKNVGGEDAIDDLMKLRIADASSNQKSDFNPEELDELSKRIAEVRAKEMALSVKDLDINGNDLMQNFQVEGHMVGKVLNYLLDQVIEEPLLNKKLDLLRLAKEYLAVGNKQ